MLKLRKIDKPKCSQPATSAAWKLHKITAIFSIIATASASSTWNGQKNLVPEISMAKFTHTHTTIHVDNVWPVTVEIVRMRSIEPQCTNVLKNGSILFDYKLYVKSKKPRANKTHYQRKLNGNKDVSRVFDQNAKISRIMHQCSRSKWKLKHGMKLKKNLT